VERTRIRRPDATGALCRDLHPERGFGGDHGRYGARWPWNTTFIHSLPAPRGTTYDPQRDLAQTRKREQTTGKVIAELKFAFWQSMFTARHDVRVWNHQILTLFPNATGMTAAQLRGRIYSDLDAARKLRNRVAHHDRFSPAISPTTSLGCSNSSNCAPPQRLFGCERWRKSAR